MKGKKELYPLRKSFSHFNNPIELKSESLAFFDENYNFPLISGYVFDDKEDWAEWKLRYIPPRGVGDELTLRNFFEGLEKISTLREGNLKNFKGTIYYGGVESRNSKHIGETIFFTEFSNLNEEYSLYLEFSRLKKRTNNDVNELAYSANTKHYVSEIQKVMASYMWPHRRLK